MSNSPTETPVTVATPGFDPCGTEDSAGGCSTCPMRTECIPRGNDEPDFFVDPSEPEPEGDPWDAWIADVLQGDWGPFDASAWAKLEQRLG